MAKSYVRPWPTAKLIAASLLVLGSASCDRPESEVLGPGAAKAARAADMPGRPFYYYLHQPVWLDVDPSRIVVTAAEAPETALRSALAGTGVSFAGTRRLGQTRDHWLVRFADGTGPISASAAVARLRKDARFAFVSPVYTTAEEVASEVVPLDRVVVQFRASAAQYQIDSLIAALHLSVVRSPRPDSNFTSYVLRYPTDGGADALSIAALLDSDRLVEWADPDKLTDRRIWSVPSDPYYPQQFFLKNFTTRNGIRVDINVEPAWDLTLGSSAVRVAIIDDGVDWTHQDIGGLAQGYDLFWPNVGPNESALQPYGNDSHGTSVAGIIAGLQNGVGVAGIAPGVTINYARILRHTAPLYPGDPGPGTEGYVGDAKVADAINWAWNNSGARSDVISNSWGGGTPSTAISVAIKDATTKGRDGKGAVVVFAAGNFSNRDQGVIARVSYPATLSATTSVIAVGAIDRYGALTNYTPEGSELTVVAPSGRYTVQCIGDIVTTERWGSPGCNDGPFGDVNYTSSFSGTSAAAPQVAAVAALLLSREPSLTSASVRSRIRTGADSWGAATQFGAGKLNAYRTLVPPSSPPPPPPSECIPKPGGPACRL